MNEFIKDTLSRTIYTVCECFLGLVMSMALITEIDWTLVLSSCAFSALITVVKCIAVKTKPTTDLE